MFKKFLLIIFLLIILASTAFYYFLDETYKNISTKNILFVIDDIHQNDEKPIFLLSQFFPDANKLQFIFINEEISILRKRAKTKTLLQLYSEYETDKKIELIKKDIEGLFDNTITIDCFINIDKNIFKDFFKLFDENINQNLLNNITDKTNYYNYVYSTIKIIKNTVNNINRTKLFKLLLFIKHNKINTDIELKNLLYLIKLQKISIVFADIPIIQNKKRIEIDTKYKNNIVQLLINSYRSNSFLNNKTIIEVLNASNTNRIASKAANKLIENGFDVFNWSNSKNKIDNTLIIDLINNEEEALKIRKLFNCGEILILPAPKNFADMTVLIGQDCNISDKFDIKPKQPNI